MSNGVWQKEEGQMIEYAKKVFVFVACVAIGFMAYTVLSGNIDERRVDSIRADLQRIEAQQRDIVKRLDSISKGLDKSIVITEGISSRVTEVTGLAESIEGRINSSKGRLIENDQRITEGQRILQSIRKRDEIKSP